MKLALSGTLVLNNGKKASVGWSSSRNEKVIVTCLFRLSWMGLNLEHGFLGNDEVEIGYPLNVSRDLMT